MRIDANFAKLPEIQADRTEQAGRLPNRANMRDSSNLPLAQDVVNTAAAETVSASEVRLEKVEALRLAIAEGTYNPPVEDIASAIVKEHLATGPRRK